MVSRLRNESVVEFDSTSEKVPTSEWVTKQTMAKVKVPQIDDPPIGNKDPLGANCGDCCCRVMEPCECGKSKKIFETVQVLTETSEELIGEKLVTNRIPRIVERETRIEVPEEFFVDEKYEEPFLVRVMKIRKVPTIVMKEVDEIRTRAVKKDVQFD